MVHSHVCGLCVACSSLCVGCSVHCQLNKHTAIHRCALISSPMCTVTVLHWFDSVSTTLIRFSQYYTDSIQSVLHWFDSISTTLIRFSQYYTDSIQSVLHWFDSVSTTLIRFNQYYTDSIQSVLHWFNSVSTTLIQFSNYTVRTKIFWTKGLTQVRTSAQDKQLTLNVHIKHTHTDRQTDRPAERPTDRQTDRQTNRYIDNTILSNYTEIIVVLHERAEPGQN